MIFGFFIDNLWLYLGLLVLTTVALVFLFKRAMKATAFGFTGYYSIFILSFVLLLLFVSPFPVHDLTGKSDGTGAFVDFFFFLVINISIPAAYLMYLLVVAITSGLLPTRGRAYILLSIAVACQIAMYFFLWLMIGQ